ncbi:MAG: hypothetical protein EP339_06790 [Gammaproteobacteria bacterium]|nr:MAG: hypothetical protein EP339_06790 [Gammaproteobacteria bacterium]
MKFPVERLLPILLLVPLFVAAQPLPDDLKTVGRAELKFFLFDVYDAELLNPTGQFQQVHGPMLLRLTYHRDISNSRLLQETRTRLEGDFNRARVAKWIDHLRGLWPSVEKGDEMAFFMDSTGKGHFYFRGRHVGYLDDRDFSRAFLNIWLGEDSGYPKLTRKLRGES